MQLHFLQVRGLRPPYPPGWGHATDPAFLEWHKVHIGFKNQHTKLNTNQAITVMNINILVWADIIMLIFQGPKPELKL